MSELEAGAWWEWTGLLPASRQEEAVARLTALGYDQWWVDQPLDHTRIAEGWLTEQSRTAMVSLHVYPPSREAAAALSAALADLTESASIDRVAARDYLATWREGRQVVPLRDGWSIAPPWLAGEAPDPARVIIIDPGLAFGAGDHPTTRDSGILLLETLRPGERVLDLGAGSGVLSILARRAGSGPAVAVEIDALAAAEIPRNMALNGVDGVTVLAADARQLAPDQQFDLVLLNIGAREAKALRPLCDQIAAPGARLIISGLAEWAAGGVAEAYIGSGWRTRARRQAGSDWGSLVMSRDPQRLRHEHVADV